MSAKQNHTNGSSDLKNIEITAATLQQWPSDRDSFLKKRTHLQFFFHDGSPVYFTDGLADFSRPPQNRDSYILEPSTAYRATVNNYRILSGGPHFEIHLVFYDRDGRRIGSVKGIGSDLSFTTPPETHFFKPALRFRGKGECTLRDISLHIDGGEKHTVRQGCIIPANIIENWEFSKNIVAKGRALVLECHISPISIAPNNDDFGCECPGLNGAYFGVEPGTEYRYCLQNFCVLYGNLRVESKLFFFDNKGSITGTIKENLSDFNFITPAGTRYLKIVLATKNTGKLLLTGITITSELYDFFDVSLHDFLGSLDTYNTEQFVLFFSGTKSVEKSGTDHRHVDCAKALKESGIPTVFSYHRLSEYSDTAPYDGGCLLQLPMDVIAEKLNILCDYDFGNRKKILAIGCPHSIAASCLSRFREKGWTVLYDCADDWEAIHKAGKAPWYRKSFEQYIVLNSERVFTAGTQLREKLAGYKGNPDIIGITPEALPGILPLKKATREKTP